MSQSTTLASGAIAGARSGSGRRTNVALWVLQALLAALFLFAGGMKLTMPVAELAKVSPLPPLFLKFVACCEILGALGLVLPGALRIRPGLTPLAAAGLVGIMIGATTLTVMTMGIAPAILPFVTGLLLLVVIRGRWRRA